MDIISSIRKQLKAAADPKVAAIHRRFFKEKVRYYGLRSAAVGKISLAAWKEASRLHQKEVFEYVLKRRKTMPRTALRYAIELMPPKLKKTAMQKPWEGI